MSKWVEGRTDNQPSQYDPFVFRFTFFFCAGLCCCCAGFLWWRAAATLQLQCVRFSLWWPLWWHMDSRYLGSVVVEHGLQGAQAQLWCMGVVVPCHVGSSWTRDRTHVPCTGRWILNHYTTREGEGNGTPLQQSCLENPMDRGTWQAAVHGVVKSRTQLSDFTFTFHFHVLEKEMATHSDVLAWAICCSVPGQSQRQKSLVGCCIWGRTESDTT